jgi:hypothetical protein
MLDRRQRPSWTDRSQSAVDCGASEARSGTTRGRRRAKGVLGTLVDGLRAASVQPRLAVGLALIAGGLVWAVARGLHFYGLAPSGIGYDLDQPPLLLALVGGWLLVRRRRQ